jgi:hypothetical protein
MLPGATADTGPLRAVGAGWHAGALVLLFAGWHWSVTGGVTLRALAAFALVVALAFAFGHALVLVAPLPERCRGSVVVRFAGGYLLLNTLVFALALAAPVSVTTAFAIAGIGGLATVLATRRRFRRVVPPAPRAPDAAALLIAGAAATLWCRDALDPLLQDGSNTVVRLWGDSFVHARLISAFMHADGIASLSDIRISGTPAYLYHYASYALPALGAAVSQAGAYETFASFMLPVGVLLTGLAAYALACSLWGGWPGVAAAAAIMLVPDAFQQGFGNRYLSYNFMQQVNVAGLYGVAVCAFAWIFVLDGCRRRREASVVLVWFVAAATLAYKAHLFVANALLILIYPCAFFPRLGPASRIGIAIAFVATWALGLALAASFERAPTLRFDGTGAATYLANVAWNYDPGALGGFFGRVLRDQPAAAPLVPVYGAAMLTLSTFGVWLVVTPLTAWSLRRSVPAAILWFPFLITLNYLALSLGLALDVKGIGSPDELLNRPLVWAYFAVAAWTGGAAYFRVFGDALPRRPRARAALAALAALGFAGPLLHAANLQTFPRWGPAFASFAAANPVPTCLIAAARFLREASGPEELIQDADNDLRFIVAAFAERQAFATFTTNRPPDALLERVWELGALRRMTDAGEIRHFAGERRIAWYLLHPDSEVGWPPAVLDAPAFACDGYRVYRLDR